VPFGALTYRPEFPKCFRTLVVKIEKTNSNSTGDFSKRINFNRVDPFIGSTLVVKIKKNRNPLFFFLQETGAHRVSRYGRREGRLCPRGDCPRAARGPSAVLAQSLLRPCKGPCRGARCLGESAAMKTSCHGSKRRVPHYPRTGSRGGRVSSRRTVAAVVCAFVWLPLLP
jgi:hypothetical protein